MKLYNKVILNANLYKYIVDITSTTKQDDLINLKCSLGHSWKTKAKNIASGTGCPSCAIEARKFSIDWGKYKEKLGTISDKEFGDLVGATSNAAYYARKKFKIKAFIPDKDPKESSYRALFTSYSKNAINRKLEFNLSFEEFIQKLKLNCFYCGSPPLNTFNYSKNKTTGLKSRKTSLLREEATIFYNGIDRVDNTKGYTLENCVTCCLFCNYAKKNRTLEEFEIWLNRLVEYRLTKLEATKKKLASLRSEEAKTADELADIEDLLK